MPYSTPPTSPEDVETAIRSLSVPPFAISANALSVSYNGPDADLDLSWDGQKQRFVVEYKSAGTPKQIADAINQVRGFAAASPGAAPMIVAPFLNASEIDRLVAQGISAVDLSGNFGIVVPRRWLVVRTGNKNQYPSSAPIKNVYRGVSSLVARALMLRGTFASPTAIQRDVSSVSPIALSTISKVLKSLENELIIDRSREIRVVRPELLLARLSANYAAPSVRKRVLAKVGVGEKAFELMSANAAEFNLLFAADGAPFETVLPSSNTAQRLYASSIEKLMRNIPMDESSRFPDIDLIETTDSTVYYGARKLLGVPRTSLLQTYLELQAGGKRERQAADSIREDILTTRAGTAA